ncbi:MAG: type II secretion system protein [Patescibacteria group bacterium]
MHNENALKSGLSLKESGRIKIIKIISINMLRKNKGFTLIELLVVIAIIGILSSVVLASLNTARAKGSDAAIKSSLSNMRAQAEILYDDASCYTADATSPYNCTFAVFAAATCTGGAADNIWKDAKIAAALLAAGNASNGTGIGRATCAQAVNGGAWAISVPLKTNSAESWCIDSNAASKQRTGVITTTSC